MEITDGGAASSSSGEDEEVQQQAAEDAVPAQETMMEGRSELLPVGCLLPREQQDAVSGESEDIMPARCGGEEQGILEEVEEVQEVEEEEQKGEGENSRDEKEAEDEVSHVPIRRNVNQYDVMWANQKEVDGASQAL